MQIISKNIEKILKEAFDQFSVLDWDNLFWIAHPGGPAILDQIEAKLQLGPRKLECTHSVLDEYGNMSSTCMLFIMDNMRQKSEERESSSMGEGGSFPRQCV